MGSHFFRGKNHDAAAAPNGPAERVITVSPKKVRILRKKAIFFLFFDLEQEE